MILVNGAVSETIPANDRGLAYGDGLFETIAVKQGEPKLWDLHWARLKQGCDRLSISSPSEILLLEDISVLLDNSSDELCVVKIIITRVSASRGYRTSKDDSHRRIVSLSAWPDYPAGNRDEGVECMICNTRLARQPLLAGIKHLNRLEQVMARMEWHDQHVAEGIVMDAEDNIIEGTMSNIFFISNNTLVTPILSDCGVAGVQRQNIMNMADRHNIAIEQKPVSVKDMANYQEAFITNSLIGLWPVRRIANHVYGIGKLTRQFQTWIDQ